MFARAKPPLCKGRWHGGAVTEGLRSYGGGVIFGQCHNPSVCAIAQPALRARAPLSLRDISPHCGESPITQGGLWVAVINLNLGPGGVNRRRSKKR